MDGNAFDAGYRKTPNGFIKDGAVAGVYSHGNGPETRDWGLALWSDPSTTLPRSYGHVAAFQSPEIKLPCRTVNELMWGVLPNQRYALSILCGTDNCKLCTPGSDCERITAGAELNGVFSWPQGGEVRLLGAAYGSLSSEYAISKQTSGFSFVRPVVGEGMICE